MALKVKKMVNIGALNVCLRIKKSLSIRSGSFPSYGREREGDFEWRAHKRVLRPPTGVDGVWVTPSSIKGLRIDS